MNIIQNGSVTDRIHKCNGTYRIFYNGYDGHSNKGYGADFYYKNKDGQHPSIITNVWKCGR